jgi:hypothetical protein
MNVGLKKHTKQIFRLISSCLKVSELVKGEEINYKNRVGDREGKQVKIMTAFYDS